MKFSLRHKLASPDETQVTTSPDQTQVSRTQHITAQRQPTACSTWQHSNVWHKPDQQAAVYSEKAPINPNTTNTIRSVCIWQRHKFYYFDSECHHSVLEMKQDVVRVYTISFNLRFWSKILDEKIQLFNIYSRPPISVAQKYFDAQLFHGQMCVVPLLADIQVST